MMKVNIFRIQFLFFDLSNLKLNWENCWLHVFHKLNELYSSFRAPGPQHVSEAHLLKCIPPARINEKGLRCDRENEVDNFNYYK